MTPQELCTLDEAKTRIAAGATLLVAGDENLLSQLPPGNWIGGTIPYFMGGAGGVFSEDKLFVTTLPDYVTTKSIKVYDEQSLPTIYQEIPANGLGFIIIPGMSQAHLSFASRAPHYQDFARRPLVGWISGINLDNLGKISPKVFDGKSVKPIENAAVVLHADLPATKAAELKIINIFKQGDGDTIAFPSTGFTAKEVLVNGQEVNFAEYLTEKGADTKLPLVADYSGSMINISFQQVDQEKKEVAFYAPVFEGMDYKLAAPVGDYVDQFNARVPGGESCEVGFSCNCILNYLYAELEGKQTADFVGPMTFGEIAYQLLNQTLVYLAITDIGA